MSGTSRLPLTSWWVVTKAREGCFGGGEGVGGLRWPGCKGTTGDGALSCDLDLLAELLWLVLYFSTSSVAPLVDGGSNISNCVPDTTVAPSGDSGRDSWWRMWCKYVEACLARPMLAGIQQHTCER